MIFSSPIFVTNCVPHFMHYAGARETSPSWDSGPPKHAPLPCTRPPFENPESAPVTDCANPQLIVIRHVPCLLFASLPPQPHLLPLRLLPWSQMSQL